jgi:hypothetical protein
MSRSVSCGHPVAYGESIGVGFCPVSVFFLLFTGKAACPRAAIDTADHEGDDLTGVYVRHALPIVQQQLLDTGVHLAKIIDGNFWERSCRPELVLYRHESNP